MDLDEQWFQDNYLSMGDSGAIIVGSGEPDVFHGYYCCSNPPVGNNYGSRVDLQGWGEEVFSLGFGSFSQYDGDYHRTYIDNFTETSAASPVVAGAAVLVQDWVVQNFGVPLDGEGLRDLLRETGLPQSDLDGLPAADFNIGPLPNVRAAYEYLATFDSDNDGSIDVVYGGEDCNDDDASFGPNAPEQCDGLDHNCDGLTDDDHDADGYIDAELCGGDDCADYHPEINPAAEEIWYDDIDQNCDGASDFDADKDSHEALAYGGTDCNDYDEAISPDAVEVWYDGVDQDCSGGEDFDADLDGYLAYGYRSGDDCDDENPDINPGAEEIKGDFIDQDCDGLDPLIPPPPKEGGCSCSSATQTGPGWLLLVAGMLGLGARRRQG